jgi:hypothetical protein
VKIKLYWPKCNLCFKDIEFNGNDALFLECSLEEAKEQLFHYLTDGQIDQCLRGYNPISNPGQFEFGIETDKVCFLITKDQKLLLPEPWYFPYTGQWNAYNPFRKIKETEIKEIGELSDLVIEVVECDISGD